MKKLLLNFWRFINSIFLQLILSYVAFITWEEAIRIGEMEDYIVEQGKEYIKSGRFEKIVRSTSDVSVAITSGYNGGAIAMGLVSCVCILGVVWLQINKTKP